MGFFKGIFSAIGAKALDNGVEIGTQMAVNRIQERQLKRRSKRDEKSLENLEKLKILYDSGALDEKDYELKKIGILYNSGGTREGFVRFSYERG